MSMLLLPIVLILLVAVILISTIGSAFSAVSQGGYITYNEEKFQDYADQQYSAEFGSSACYEDNLLLVFLVDEEYYDYNYIAWVGDHIDTKINNMFGNEYTALGQAINSNVNQNNYKYSLDSNLAAVMGVMQEKIEALGLDSSFTCSKEHNTVSSHLTNKSLVEMTDSTVNDALAEFTQATGISVVIVVEDMEDVFGKYVPIQDIITVVICIIVLIIAIVLIVKAVRKRKQDGGNDGNDKGGNGNNSNYNKNYNNNYNRDYNNRW